MSFDAQIPPDAMGDFVRTEYINRFGHTPGAFLDLGAYLLSPQSISYPFLRAGWSALLLEADPGNCGRLVNDVARESMADRAHCLCAALLPTAGITPWYSVLGGGEVSSADEAWTKTPWAQGQQYFPMSVVGITPADLFARFGFAWDCISLDLEGMTVKVFDAMPWPALARARMVIAEMHPSSMMPALEPLGFRVIHSDCVNAVAVRGDK